MKISVFKSCSLILFPLLLLLLPISRSEEHAALPPRGWNSYDSFCWTISEEEFLQSAEIVSKRLLRHGYKYVVVDYLWYRRKVEGAYVDSLGFDVIDKWGRMQPDPVRWPSSRGGKGFTEVAKKVHAMGLKFGIHVMNGISTQAVNANTLILDTNKRGPYKERGRRWHAQDIGVKERACAWMRNGFMGVNTNLMAGKVFLKSLYEQYAAWGVDFIKHDCTFGEDFDIGEINVVSQILKELDRQILYSLSPGTSVTPEMAKSINGLVNMYRITGDDWDTWEDVASHFNVSRDFAAANMVGSTGLYGKSWPDLDMLPLGWLTDQGTNVGPYRQCKLTLNEQRTQMTLWSMAKSPLMFGGDLRHLDVATYDLITNPTALEINAFSSRNMEFPYITEKRILTKSENQGTHATEEDLTTNMRTFGLTSCKNPRANAWSIKTYDQDLQQVCWNKTEDNRVEMPFCLYKKEASLSSDEEEQNHKHKYPEKVRLLANEDTEFCFGASPRKKLTSKEFKRGSLSPCRQDANQMWEMHGNRNGTLKNSYSGLCAVLDLKKAPVGVRAWIATGRNGEIYLAFFNLNRDKTVISANIQHIVEAVSFSGTSCRYHEVWSGKDFGVTKELISMAVDSHGSALFTLHCY